MKQLIICILLLICSSCQAQELSNSEEVYQLKKEISKASLRKLAFYECLNSSVNDSLSLKINDSSKNNLYYRMYGFDPMSIPSQRPYIDSLISFANIWGKNEYPNLDKPNSKMHLTNCLNMYESYELDKLINYIFDKSVDENIIDSNIQDLEEKISDPGFRYKYYDFYKILSDDEKNGR